MAKVEVDLEKWHLTDPEAMAKCLKDMSDDGFRGMVRVIPDPTVMAAVLTAPAGTPKPEGPIPNVWELELNDNEHPERVPVDAALGQVVVWFGGVLQVVSAEQFTKRFGVAL